MMSLRNLGIFVAVAESGGVSRAARQLNTVQSNVTARLKDLEREMDAELFHRTSTGMVPTAAGEVLLEHARRMQHMAETAQRAVRDTAQGGGLLRIGTLETTAAVRLPAILMRFYEAFPRAEVRLTAGTTEALLDGVLAYRHDGAFVAGTVEHADLVGEAVFDERLVLVRPRAAPVGPVPDQPVVLMFRRGCSYRAYTEQWLREEGVHGYRTMEFGTLDGILGCIAAGLGISLLPKAVVESSSYRAKLKTTALADRFAAVPTYFVRRRDAAGGAALEAFLGCVRRKPPVRNAKRMTR